LGASGELIAFIKERPNDPLGVGNIHLTAKGFYIKIFFHGEIAIVYQLVVLYDSSIEN